MERVIVPIITASLLAVGGYECYEVGASPEINSFEKEPALIIGDFQEVPKNTSTTIPS